MGTKEGMGVKEGTGGLSGSKYGVRYTVKVGWGSWRVQLRVYNIWIEALKGVVIGV